MQPGKLLGELHRIAMPPLRPESALSAIGAQMRTTARELHDDGALAAPVRIARVIDQLPAHAIRIEVADHRRIGRGMRLAVHSICNAAHRRQIARPAQRTHQIERGLLAFAAHDEVDVGAVTQYLVPHIGRMHAAVDDEHIGQRALEQFGDLHHRDMRGAGTRMPEHHHIDRLLAHGLDDLLGRHRAELGIDKPHVETMIDQRAANRQQPKRRQMFARHAAADGGVRWIDEGDALHVSVVHRVNLTAMFRRWRERTMSAL